MSFLRFAAAALVCVLGAGALRAADGGFTATLAPAQRSAAGLTKLSAAEDTALDTLVAREVTAARQGGVRAFAGSFVSRRRPAERAQAGLDRLTPGEQDRLDDFVAAALAAGPVFTAPASKLASLDTAVKDPRHLEVHGEVSFLYGWGSGGRSVRGGSIAATFTDPAGRYQLAVAFSHYEGDGFLGRGFGGAPGFCWPDR
ncbi:MAG: hypothetical protein HY302_00015 [Opitutae bacterium]|nr:hypothetical protein [Opitutae bacterium]